MKPILILFAILLSACSTFRGILTDEYTTESEVRAACLVEVQYRNLQDSICDEAVALFRKLEDSQVLLDEDSFRDWLEDRLRREIGI